MKTSKFTIFLVFVGTAINLSFCGNEVSAREFKLPRGRASQTVINSEQKFKLPRGRSSQTVINSERSTTTTPKKDTSNSSNRARTTSNNRARTPRLSQEQCAYYDMEIRMYFVNNRPSEPSTAQSWENWRNTLEETLGRFSEKYPECKTVPGQVSDSHLRQSQQQQLEIQRDSQRRGHELKQWCYQGYADACREIGDSAGYQSARRRVCNLANLKYDARSDSCY
ncbi:hypothetical protein myaer87_13560 [Microcystis aeruginosa NIES-87]|nr:hypothetical protein myaer87_13560 [Microcystis aeruginosa NIES-87]